MKVQSLSIGSNKVEILKATLRFNNPLIFDS